MCLRSKLLDLNRYQIQYPIIRSNKNDRIVGNNPSEMGYSLIDLVESDTASFSFSPPFSGAPNVIVGLLTAVNEVGNVNVYAESISASGGVIRSSAPITGKVIVQAVYFGS